MAFFFFGFVLFEYFGLLIDVIGLDLVGDMINQINELELMVAGRLH